MMISVMSRGGIISDRYRPDFESDCIEGGFVFTRGFAVGQSHDFVVESSRYLYLTGSGYRAMVFGNHTCFYHECTDRVELSDSGLFSRYRTGGIDFRDPRLLVSERVLPYQGDTL
jgi:hypothetical protein